MILDIFNKQADVGVTLYSFIHVSCILDICNKQADVGPCTQYIKRWYYNSITRDCEEFTYGGCVGNHNNFESRMQCMTYCDSSR